MVGIVISVLVEESLMAATVSSIIRGNIAGRADGY